MATQAGVKIFRTTTTSEDVSYYSLYALRSAIEAWYKDGCKDVKLTEIKVSD